MSNVTNFPGGQPPTQTPELITEFNYEITACDDSVISVVGRPQLTLAYFSIVNKDGWPLATVPIDNLKYAVGTPVG